ncbi:MAG TPA: HD domain-containing protein [Patescibacteria group bacterium]|nr:HD domain-containing protein [Patescibacteria group bacterium]
MIINDRIYGKVKITSPGLIELIQSKSMQRLKKIAQHGLPNEYYPFKGGNRFEHCVGVMLLLERLGAKEEEQAAGLLHDVSHTAFSHVIDWVVGTGKTEDYQDEHHAEIINCPELSQILTKHKIDVGKIANYHHYFPLLEKAIPDLCADRIDYSLREFPLSVVKRCLKALVVQDNKIVFKDAKSALTFAQNYLKRQIEHWGGYEAVVRYAILAKILKKALRLKIIVMDDFRKDDAYIINKLKKSKDEEILSLLKVLRKKSLKELSKGQKIAHKKFRYVDPLFLRNGVLIRLSKVDKKFKKELDKARKENSKGIRLPLLAA